MSIREAVPVETHKGVVFAYPPAGTRLLPSGLPAEIATPRGSFRFSQTEALVLAKTIAPQLDPEQAKQDTLKPYQAKAKAAHEDLTETIESWTRTLNAARSGQWSGYSVAESLEELLLALSEPLTALREIKDGEL